MKLENPVSPNWARISALLAVVVVSLVLIDRSLEKVESAEIHASAQRNYREGARLLEEGKADAAVTLLNNAHSLNRDDDDYELQLAEALAAAGKRTAAEPLLQEVLQREPNSGPANLMAARWMVQSGKMADAEAHYHRAIYGEWPAKQNENRLSTRMELVDLLARNGEKQELTGELISIEALDPSGVTVRKKLASLYLFAGAPARAVDIYKALLKSDASDADAWEGLGNAQLQEGNYRAAGQAYFRALLRDPGNKRVRDRVMTLTGVTGLDPTPRELTSAEKYRRSVRILQLTRDTLGECTAPASDADLLKASDSLVAGKMPAHATNEMAEQVLQLAVKLWQSEPGACQRRIADQTTLGLIMKKLTS